MKKNKDFFPWPWLMAISVFVIVVWFATWFLTWRFIPLAERSSFGEMFGSVNALFSGLAMGGIIVAIFLQKKDLALQKEELKLTREEFITQNETLKKQRFENTFFHLLNIHLEKKNNLLSDHSNGVFLGLLGSYDERKKMRVFKRQQNDSSFPLYKAISNYEDLETVIIEVFTSMFNGQSTEISSYFTHLYICFKFIYDTTLINSDEKSFYASTIKSQLSNDEMRLLFYYCLVPEMGKPYFTYLIKEYNILENLNLSRLHPYYQFVYDMVIYTATNPFEKK